MGGPSPDEGVSADPEGRECKREEEGEGGGEEKGENREKGGYKRTKRTEINWFHLACDIMHLEKIGHQWRI